MWDDEHELSIMWHTRRHSDRHGCCVNSKEGCGSDSFPCMRLRAFFSTSTLQLPLAAQNHSHLTGNAKQSACGGVCVRSPAKSCETAQCKKPAFVTLTQLRRPLGLSVEPNCPMSVERRWMGSYFIHSVGWKGYCSSPCGHHISQIYFMLPYLFPLPWFLQVWSGLNFHWQPKAVSEWTSLAAIFAHSPFGTEMRTLSHVSQLQDSCGSDTSGPVGHKYWWVMMSYGECGLLVRNSVTQLCF